MEYFDTDQITAQSVAIEDYYSRYTGEQIDNILYNSSVHYNDSSKHITDAERAAWNGKQPAITDLATIRGGAALGATAYGWGNHALAGYLTEHQSLAAYATQSWVESKGYLTEHQSLAGYATVSALNGKQDVITDLSDIRSNAYHGELAYSWGNHTTVGYYVGNVDTIKVIKVDNAVSADSCSGNAASATQLQTKRTLWGQSFDGSANVSGDIIGAASGINIEKGNEINCYYENLFLNHRGNGSGYEGKSTGNILALVNGGYFGIGTRAPQYKLDVAGDIHTSNDAYVSSALYLGNGVNPDSLVFQHRRNGFTTKVHNDSNALWIGIEDGATTKQPLIIWDTATNQSVQMYGLYAHPNWNVGIGRNDPQYKLDVAGSVRIGNAILTYNHSNHSLGIQDSDGNPLNLYTTGGISAYGISEFEKLESLRVDNVLDVGTGTPIDIGIRVADGISIVGNELKFSKNGYYAGTIKAIQTDTSSSDVGLEIGGFTLGGFINGNRKWIRNLAHLETDELVMGKYSFSDVSIKNINGNYYLQFYEDNIGEDFRIPLTVV